MSALFKECIECGTRFYKGSCGMRWFSQAQCCSNACKAERQLARAWAAVDRPKDPALCWLWTGGRGTGGYGVFGRVGTDRKAHREAWRREFGEIPAGLCVLHRCDTPLCIRPSHLFLGTKQENNMDRDKKGRTARGSRGGNSRLDDGRVGKIKKLLASGISQAEAARIFGVGSSTVGEIARGNTWKHVPAEVSS